MRASEPPPDETAAAEAARRAITVVRSPSPRDYTLEAGEAVTVVSFDAPAARGADDRSAEEATLNLSAAAARTQRVAARAGGARRRDDSNTCWRSWRPSAVDASCCKRPGPSVCPNSAPRSKRCSTSFRRDRCGSMREPFDAVVLPQARIVLCAYGANEVCVEALADVLTARAAARGRLPAAPA